MQINCFILHPDEWWVLPIFNSLLLQHRATSLGDVKSFRWWWCFQRVHF